MPIQFNGSFHMKIVKSHCCCGRQKKGRNETRSKFLRIFGCHCCKYGCCRHFGILSCVIFRLVVQEKGEGFFRGLRSFLHCVDASWGQQQTVLPSYIFSIYFYLTHIFVRSPGCICEFI